MSCKLSWEEESIKKLTFFTKNPSFNFVLFSSMIFSGFRTSPNLTQRTPYQKHPLEYKPNPLPSNNWNFAPRADKLNDNYFCNTIKTPVQKTVTTYFPLEGVNLGYWLYFKPPDDHHCSELSLCPVMEVHTQKLVASPPDLPNNSTTSSISF